ncbi:MAG: stage V sporulation protein AD, partial [Clostridia bacterium]|nr:stage V sporulation protein AD [Clostridia bacterium]
HNKPRISCTFSIVGDKEGAGPIGRCFDRVLKDDYFGEKTFEKAECKMLSTAIEGVIKKGDCRKSDIDAIVSGDLLNQIVSASFAARDFNIPYIGRYNACSTMSEGLALASVLIDGGYMSNVIVATGSHFSTAERQYRYPLEFGSTRPPQSQWTVTGSGATIISKDGDGPVITAATFGKVMDYGITDANNMGAAMAPAAMDTLFTHFEETGLTPRDYDLIVTGDLGALGSRILKHILCEKGYDISANHVDCGEIIYNIEEEEYQGGSGAGCSAVVFNSYIYPNMKNRELKRVLFLATGALLSTVTTQQGETIPCISHAVSLESL